MKLPIPFRNPRTYPGHSGVDFGQARGTPIPASGPGEISHRGTSTRGGCYIWVKYDALPRLVGYHHMDTHGGCPPDGSRVTEGTRLGYVGSRGSRSTGPHLHSEISGEATTAGYWKYFDSTRVVGANPAGGNHTPISPDPIPEFDFALQRRQREETMYVQHEDKRYPQVYATFTDANGALRLRTVKANEAAIALAGGLIIAASDKTLTDLGIEAGFNAQGTIPLPKVDAGNVTGGTVDLTPVLDAVANIPKAVNDDAAARLAN